MNEQTITCVGDGRRLDVLLSEQALSRSRASALIARGMVQVCGKVETKPSFKAPVGADVTLTLPAPKPTAAQPQALPLSILYEDDCLAVVVKPNGMVTHPAAGNEDGTLVNALLYHLKNLSGIGGEMRPGIVHRLDKDTSGVMLVAKSDAAHAFLSEELKQRRMEKHYRALVMGRMKEPSGEIELPIGRSQKDRKKMAVTKDGRYALTRWQLLEQMDDRALLDVHILTGRTHQIRVHMQAIGHPVLGDVLYGAKNAPRAPRLMLHAYSLAFTHPETGERMTFVAPCPFSTI